MQLLITGSVTLHGPPVAILKSVKKHLRRDKSYQFRPPKVAKRKFLCSNFGSPKVQYKEKWDVDIFRNGQASRENYHILFSSRGVCSKCTQS